MTLKVCYNCGKELKVGDVTVEHVPAKNLYDGFSEEFKKNRITVPACFACNNLYSKIDQELRDVLAVRSDELSQRNVLTGKGIRSILRRSNWKDRVHVDIIGRVVAVNFSYNDLRQLHIKNFKALFFRKYSLTIPADFEVEIISEGDKDTNESNKFLYGYLRIDNEFEYSGHPDIFKFILKDMTIDDENDLVYSSGNFQKLIGVIGLLVYHDDIATIVMAGKKDFIDSCKPD